MAVNESNVLLRRKDENGDEGLIYPITKLECIDGADDELAAIRKTIPPIERDHEIIEWDGSTNHTIANGCISIGDTIYWDFYKISDKIVTGNVKLYGTGNASIGTNMQQEFIFSSTLVGDGIYAYGRVNPDENTQLGMALGAYTPIMAFSVSKAGARCALDIGENIWKVELTFPELGLYVFKQRDYTARISKVEILATPYDADTMEDIAAESTGNKTTELSENSTDYQYPSAKATWDAIVKNKQTVQSDWDVSNEADPAYIKNKPFGMLPDLYEEQNLTFTKSKNVYSATFNANGVYPVSGDTYIVVWDGVEYTCTARSVSFTTSSQAFSQLSINCFLGNPSVYAKSNTKLFGASITYYTSEDRGEPFAIVTNVSGDCLCATTGGTHTIRVYPKNNIKKIDPKYLPDASSQVLTKLSELENDVGYITSTEGCESVSNKIQDIIEPPSGVDTSQAYPSAAAVISALDFLGKMINSAFAAAESLSNRVSSINSSTGNDKYPTAKAVYDFVTSNQSNAYTKAQSNTRYYTKTEVAAQIAAILPQFSSDDEGKVLGIKDGKLAWIVSQTQTSEELTVNDAYSVVVSDGELWIDGDNRTVPIESAYEAVADGNELKLN